VEATAQELSIAAEKSASGSRRRTAESAIRAFFGSNAFVAIIVLTLITIFLFREGSGFFGQNLANLRLYRQAGLEYVDIIRGQAERQTALSRQLGDLRLQQMRAGADQAALEKFDEFANKFSDDGEQLNGLVSDATDQAQALRETMLQLGSHAGASVIESETQDERRAAAAPTGNEAEQMAALRSATDKFAQIADSMKAQINELLAAPPALTNPKASKSFAKWKAEGEEYLKQLPAVVEKLRTWDPNKPVPAYRGITSFLFGTQWITASFWQDWYGIIPLFVGSLMVSVVALLIAVPLGVCGAIYVSEVASPIEKPDQTVHRIHFGDPVGRAGFLRDCCAWRNHTRYLTRLVHAMGAVLSNQRAPECFHGGLFARLDGCAYDFYSRRRRASQCASRFQGSFVCTGGKSAPDDPARARAGFVVWDRFCSVARTWPRDRRNDGGAALRRKPNRYS
jgi:hypothetical protein